MRSRLLAMLGLLALVGGMVACGDDDGGGGADDADTTTTAAPADDGGDTDAADTGGDGSVSTLTFAGTTYDLTRVSCVSGPEGEPRWMAESSDGDVVLTMNGGSNYSINLRVDDDHERGPDWRMISDQPYAEVDERDDGVSGSSLVWTEDTAIEDREELGEVVEWELSC